MITLAELRAYALRARAYDKAAIDARSSTTQPWASDYYRNRARMERFMARRAIEHTKELAS